jgi:hypothetical protein
MFGKDYMGVLSAVMDELDNLFDHTFDSRQNEIPYWLKAKLAAVKTAYDKANDHD